MAAEPVRPEPVLHNGRGRNSERPAYRKKKKEKSTGNSLAVQCLGLGAFTAVAQVQSLVGELKYRKPHGGPKENRKEKRKALELGFNLTSTTYYWYTFKLLNHFELPFFQRR